MIHPLRTSSSRRLGAASLLALLPLVLGCPESDTEPEAPAEDPRLEKCPKIHMDRMAGQWIKVQGKAADHTYRFELSAQGTAEPVQKYTMWYTGGGFTKRVLEGVRRDSDFKFTEVPSGKRKADFEAGEQAIVRLYVEPKLDKCALRVSELEVTMKEGKEVERPKPGFVEYLPFPEGQPFTFRPCDGELFLAKAAKDKAVADKQLAELGGPDPATMLGEAIPVGTWSPVAEDGDPACTYDMDLYFDDRPVKDKQALPAGAPQGDFRPWYIEAWSAPYSGNHHFQIFRYRTCEGGERELIGVSCLEAVLN